MFKFKYFNSCINCGNYATKGEIYCSKCKRKYIVPKQSPYSTYDYIHKKEEKEKEKEYKCINGAKVRSKEELIISLVLELNGIKHSYEYPLAKKETSELDDFTKPDFFFQKIKTRDGKIIKNVFLEHFGINIYSKDNEGKVTEKSKNYEITTYIKLCKYRDMGLTVICTSHKDLNDSDKNINEIIIDKILDCKEGTVNYVDENMLYSDHLEEFKKSLEKVKK